MLKTLDDATEVPAAWAERALISIPQVAKAVRALIAKGDKAAEKAEQYYKAAGLHLKELKENKPDGVTWEAFVKEECGISRERADELIRIGDGRTTVAEVRKKAEERKQKHLEKSESNRCSRTPDPGSAPPKQT
jgi:hypothetical protein